MAEKSLDKLSREELLEYLDEFKAGFTSEMDKKLAQKDQLLKKTIERAKVLDEKFYLLFNNSPLGFAFCDMEGSLIDINKAYAKITGYTLEEIRKLSYWDLTPKKYEEGEALQLESLSKTGAYGPYIKEYIHKDGTLVPVQLNGFIVENYDGVKGIWSIVEDITEKIDREKQVDNQKQIVLETSKLASIGELAEGIGHEINNPLAIVIGNLGIMKEEILKESPNQEILARIFERQEDGLGRITEIVDSLRTYSREEVSFESVLDTHKLISKTQVLVGNMFEKEGVQIYTDLYAEKFNIKGNVGKFQQILMILLINAKYAIQGIELPSIRVTTENIGTDLILSVADNGLGIPDDIIKKIFDSFFTTKEKGKGTGIGLAVLADIVDKMHGKVDVVSELGVGTRFTISFPIMEQEDFFSEDELDEMDEDVVQEKLEGCALVVDDEIGIRELLVTYLEDMGLDVDVADDGDTGVQKVIERKYDFICTDMTMPRMSGNKFIEEARKHDNGDTYYFMITGGVLPTDEELDATKSYIHGYIKKPFSFDSIYNALFKYRKQVKKSA